jgi:hypothetical protein
MLRKLEATGQVFDLTSEGERYLRQNSVSEYVIREMRNLNQARRQSLEQRIHG